MPKLDTSTVKKAYQGATPAVRIYKGTQLVWPSGDIITNVTRSRTAVWNETTATSFSPPFLYWFSAPASGKVICRVWWKAMLNQGSSSTSTSFAGKCHLRIRPDTLVATPIFDQIILQTYMDAGVRNAFQLLQGLTPYRAYNAELLTSLTAMASSSDNCTMILSIDILMA